MALLAEIQSECTSKEVNVSRLLRLCLLLAEKLKHAPLKEWATHEYIVQHQLGRAAASGTARFAPYLPLAPILNRIANRWARSMPKSAWPSPSSARLS